MAGALTGGTFGCGARRLSRLVCDVETPGEGAGTALRRPMRASWRVSSDGTRLAELMSEHGIGVSHRVIRVPKLDGDYLEE
jgi:hypothetical protein